MDYYYEYYGFGKAKTDTWGSNPDSNIGSNPDIESKFRQYREHVMTSKPQNWDKAKPKKGFYACLIGCGQHVPESERIIHSQHCPGKYEYYRRRMASKGDESLAKSNVPLAEGAKEEATCSKTQVSSLENWDDDMGSEEIIKRQERKKIKKGLKFYDELKNYPTVDTVEIFMDQLRKN